jgi:spore germination cell wall hydrolase CwlJ-like protein
MRILLVVIVCLICIKSYFDITERDYRYDTDSIKVKYEDLLPSIKQQVDCLAENIYFEAGREPELGKIAVAMVTLNRVEHKSWPSSVCGVVRERNTRVCQFSWWCESRNNKKAINNHYTPEEQVLYNKAKKVALDVYINYDKHKRNDVTQGAYFYHATYINPGWKLKKTTVIGQHIFYKKDS